MSHFLLDQLWFCFFELAVAKIVATSPFSSKNVAIVY